MRHKSKLGTILVAAFAVVLGVILFKSLFKIALFAGAVFVVWKLFFDRGPREERAALPEIKVKPLDLSDVAGPREADAERARLDRELEAAIAAKQSQGGLKGTDA